MPEAEVKSAAPGNQLIVTGTPVDAAGPTPEGKKRAEFMNAFEAKQAANSNSLADRLADSGLGYFDDNTANKRYIAKLDFAEKQTPIGTPMHQVRRINWPTDEEASHGQLEGVHVLREDGSFYSIPAGVKSLGDVVDPEGGAALVGAIDPKQAKARAAIAAGTISEPKPFETEPKKAAKAESKAASKSTAKK